MTEELTPDEIEREKILSSDEDPEEAIQRIRLAEAAANADQEEEEEEEENSSSDADDADSNTQNTDDTSETSDEENEDQEEFDDSENQNKEVFDDSDDANTEDNADSEDDSAKPKVHKFKANGQEFEFTEEEIVEQFGSVFGKAMDYTRKLQQIAPYRKMVSALEEEGLSEQDLNFALDILKGDKDALKKLIAEKEIDVYDLDTETESDYTPNDYGKAPEVLQLEEITSTLASDPEYPKTVQVITEQWDQNSREAFASNPSFIVGLHNDIKTGVFDKVAPVAMKKKLFDGGKKSDLEYYMEAGAEVLQADQSSQQDQTGQQQQQQQRQRDSSKDDAQKANQRRAAGSTRKRADRKGVVDYLDDDNDENFNEWYKKLMENQ